jgi:hypothetical protein
MLGDFGWRGVWAAGAGCVAILATTRWPVEGTHFSLLDLGYYVPMWKWRGRAAGMTLTDAAYSAGLVLCAVAACWSVLRLGFRLFAIMRYRPPALQRGRFACPVLAVVLLLAVSLLAMGVGWPYRLGQRWVATAMASPATNLSVQAKPEASAPMSLTTDSQEVVLRSAVLQGRAPHARVVAVKLLVDSRKLPGAFPTLLAAVSMEGDAGIRATEARLLGMTRDARAVALLVSLMHDADAGVRVAAADALGICHSPIWPLDRDAGAHFVEVQSDPPIRVVWTPWRDGVPNAQAGDARGALEGMMLSGGTRAEREAAARALVNWPRQGTKFRYAEWGVFQANSEGIILTDLRPRLEEIPPLVRRLRGLDAQLDGLLTRDPMMPVWKPVIHLTTNVPLAVDVQVILHEGRPWVAYPAFDDLVLERRRGSRSDYSLAAAAPVGVLQDDPHAMGDLTEGYPWLLPNRRSYPWVDKPTPGQNRDVVESVGLHWQSLIVTPDRLPWMSPAEVGPDPRFDWWKRLRDVDCSWVSSRGETERFLYYDGPVGAQAPVSFRMGPAGLAITRHSPPQVDPDGVVWPEDLLVSVTPAGVVMKWATGSAWKDSIKLTGVAPRSPEHASDNFRHALERHGLTPSEANGVVTCWEPAFFRTPGLRYLRLLSRDDYDKLCPLTVRPEPSTLVRVGVLWVEFPADK